MVRTGHIAAGILGLGLAAGLALAQGRPSPLPQEPERPAPLVRVVSVARTDLRLSVQAHGTVAPRTESELVPEVSGRVVAISPALAAGGFFERDEVLLEIDPRDYQSAVARGEARVRRARSELALAQANLERLRALNDGGVASASALDEAENAARVARAARDEAIVSLEDARRSLERTQLRAPFEGRVREKRVDVGQYVSPGRPVARLYAVDYAEVRLPIPDDELAHLGLPLDSRLPAEPPREPSVVMRARFAGATREWHGRIVRTEGEIDPRSRMVHVVARVDDPYGIGAEQPGVPLSVGLFVDAQIQGRALRDVFVLPRAALREGDRIFAVDEDQQLRSRAIEVVRIEGDRIVARGDLTEGTRVCVSDPRGAREGMRVRTAPPEGS
jgi:RND family efflux transporter MFP subunit